MKIAICLAGQPRNWEVGYKNLYREFISKYDTDVFAHTWWSPEQVGRYYDSGPWGAGKYPIIENFPALSNDAYDFKDVVFEVSKTFSPERKYNIADQKYHDNTICALKSLYYSTNKVLSLCENYEQKHDIKYDWVIQTRFDIGIFIPTPDLLSLNSNNIYVDNYHINREFIFNTNMWILGEKSKFIFKNLYRDFDKNYDMMLAKQESEYFPIIKNSELAHCIHINGEQFMAFYLLFNGLLNKVIKTPLLNYNLVR